MRRGYAIYNASLLGPIGIVACDKGVELIFLKEAHFNAYLEEHIGLKEDEALCKIGRAHV